MKTVDDLVDDILDREGGFSDHPNDKGGATNHGISLRYALGIGLDLNGDGETDKDDIALVTPEEAAVLYKQDFFYGPRIHLLPECLHAQMFDISVNSGGFRAIQLLQKALNGANLPAIIEPLVVDGRMGPKTRREAEAFVRDLGCKAVNNFLVYERIWFYQRIILNDPTQGVMREGWMKRAKEFCSI